MNDDLRKEIRKVSLQNAFEHDGKTKDKIVLSKILGIVPELKNNIKDIIPEIASIVSQAAAAVKLSQQFFPSAITTVLKDLSNNERAVLLEIR